MSRPALSLVSHLALYTAFHRGPGNKLLHGLATPLVFFSALCLLAYARVPSAPMLHVGTVIALALFVLLAVIDLAGSLCLLAFTLGACAAAGFAVQSLPAVIVVPSAVALHLLAWYVAVVVGHEKLEPRLSIGAHTEDSNLYFRRRYYLAQELGVEARALDVLLQFSIAPLSVVQDVLAFLGLRRGLEHAVVVEQGRIVDRLAEGQAPLTLYSVGTPFIPSGVEGRESRVPESQARQTSTRQEQRPSTEPVLSQAEGLGMNGAPLQQLRYAGRP